MFIPNVTTITKDEEHALINPGLNPLFGNNMTTSNDDIINII
jgi:hypothetical protein